jgi:hypothetical protein
METHNGKTGNCFDRLLEGRGHATSLTALELGEAFAAHLAGERFRDEDEAWRYASHVLAMAACPTRVYAHPDGLKWAGHVSLAGPWFHGETPWASILGEVPKGTARARLCAAKGALGDDLRGKGFGSEGEAHAYAVRALAPVMRCARVWSHPCPVGGHAVPGGVAGIVAERAVPAAGRV